MPDFISDNIYLTDNGISPGNYNDDGTPYTLINDFINDKIGVEAAAIDQTSFTYTSQAEAINAAYGPDSYYAGIGIKGARTRKINFYSQSSGDPPTTYWSFESIVGNPEEPDFWKDGGDVNGQDINLKTNFLNDLLNIKNNLSEYKSILQAIYNSLDNIINGNNSGFPDFMTNDVYNDRTNIQNVINVIDSEESDKNIFDLYTYFNTATGSEVDFDIRIGELETTLTNIMNAIQTRATSGYFNDAIGTSSSERLKKWRLFWIKERIFKYTGSLNKLLAMKQAKTQAEENLIQIEETLNTLYSEKKDEWVSLPQIYATYYNPIVEEVEQNPGVFVYNTTRRISFVHSGKEFADEYVVLRKTVADAVNDGFTDDQWNPVNDNSIELAPGSGEIYNDLNSLDAEFNEYVYRIQTIDTVSDQSAHETSSLQSNILGEEINIISITNGKVKVNTEVEGYIFINNSVNFITQIQEKSDSSFELTLRNSLGENTPTTLNKLTCVAPNYYLEETEE